MSAEQHAPAVSEGKLNFVSVSSIQKYRGCNRAYFFKYVLRLQDKPPSKGMQRGIEGHARIAAYLKTGQNVLDPLEHLGVERQLIPTPGPDLMVEQPITMLVHGVPLKGFVDLVNPRSEELEITDWKFKADIGKWGSTASDLVNPYADAGVQMLGYAEWARQSFARDTVSLRHVSFQTKGRRDVQPTESRISLTVVQEKWEKVAESVDGMRAVAKEKDAFEVAPNFEACERYGGCAWKDQCFDPAMRMAAGFRKAFARANSDARASSGAGAEVTDAASGAEIPTNGEMTMSMMGSLLQKKPVTTNGAATLSAEDREKIREEKEAIARHKKDIQAEEAAAVLPPDAPKPWPVNVEKNTTTAAPNTVPILSSPGSKVIVEDHTAEATKKRGRPAKTATAEAAPATTVKNAEGLAGVHVYYRALPLGLATKSLVPYVLEQETALLTAFKMNLVDIRTATDSVMGFSKWKGYFAKQVRENPPATGYYHADRGDERVECAVDALSGILPAGNYIVGL